MRWPKEALGKARLVQYIKKGNLPPPPGGGNGNPTALEHRLLLHFPGTAHQDSSILLSGLRTRSGVPCYFQYEKEDEMAGLK